MLTAELQEIHDRFSRDLVFHRGFLTKWAGLESPLDREGQKYLIESFIRCVPGQWERFWFALLVASLHHDPRLVQGSENALGTQPSMKDCEEHILEGKNYLKFHQAMGLVDYSKTILFDEHNPFLAIEGYCRLIDEVYVIRNYLVHYSGSSEDILVDWCELEYGIKWDGLNRFLLENNGERLWGYVEMFENVSREMRAKQENAEGQK